MHSQIRQAGDENGGTGVDTAPHGVEFQLMVRYLWAEVCEASRPHQ